MSLAEDYQRQLRWRDWPAIFGVLPPLGGNTVLDLGCGIGDQSAELAARGARVIGIDANPELLNQARGRGVSNAEFRLGDLRRPLELDIEVSGIWCSFTAAYLCDLTSALLDWSRVLEPGGWIALTEIDDLFAHEPLPEHAAEVLEAYVEEALACGRYDFRMGRELPAHLQRAGFAVERVLTPGDRELAFDGPASPEILEAWAARLDRMKLLHDFCRDFELLRQAFLSCLASPEHTSRARVWSCFARKSSRRS